MGAPMYRLGKEPLPLGLVEEDRSVLMQQLKIENWTRVASESCAFKTFFSAGSCMYINDSAPCFRYAHEDLMQHNNLRIANAKKTADFFKSTDRSMWHSGSGFAKVGALYSGAECCIEGVSLTHSANNDITNAVAAGSVSSAVPAQNSGSHAAAADGLVLATFSAAIDLL
ncbi:hypothetical protein BDV93DRAFT_434527 [Ceratobasidium sp. AG-I]|nr:hypothetical protein BDV93DRAFT_434527 [Ceratobasidium sp. AG-I]